MSQKRMRNQADHSRFNQNGVLFALVAYTKSTHPRIHATTSFVSTPLHPPPHPTIATQYISTRPPPSHRPPPLPTLHLPTPNHRHFTSRTLFSPSISSPTTPGFFFKYTINDRTAEKYSRSFTLCPHASHTTASIAIAARRNTFNKSVSPPFLRNFSAVSAETSFSRPLTMCTHAFRRSVRMFSGGHGPGRGRGPMM